MIFKTKQWKLFKLCKLKKTIDKYYRVKENNGKLVSCEMKIYAQVCLNNYVYTEWTWYSKWCFNKRNKSTFTVSSEGRLRRSELVRVFFSPGLAGLQTMWRYKDGSFCILVKMLQIFNPKFEDNRILFTIIVKLFYFKILWYILRPPKFIQIGALPTLCWSANNAHK